MVAALSFALVALTAGLADATISFGGNEVIVIEGVTVGSPVMTTYSQCEGYVDHDTPVLPVTVKALFITAPGVQPTGPYGGLQAWDGGLVSAPDDHYGTGQGHSPAQFFHTLAYAKPNAFHGAGKYGFTAFAQDVGTNPALTEITTSKSVPGNPPVGAGAKVKCSVHKPFSAAQLISDMAQTALQKVAEQACPYCFKLKDTLDQLGYYSDLLNDVTVRAVVDDPPDSNYQEIAQPQAPPVLPPPGGLDATQQAAVVNLETALADDIGLGRALQTSENRAWGAINAPSHYWFVRQLHAEATYAVQLADALQQLPQLYSDLQAAFAPDLPSQFTISYADAHNWMVAYSDGITGAAATTLGQLGASSEDLQRLVDNAISLDAADMVTSDGLAALFAQNHDAFSGPLRALASWADGAAQEQPPVVSDVSPRTIDAGGGTQVTVTGTNLADVSAIDFGPSTPYSGQGGGLSCSETACTVYAPPGSGTVDVVAVGPGGPSAAVAADRVTYTQPAQPQVTEIFPSSGATSGGTEVSVRGSGLSGGIVYFGPTPAQTWSCSDTVCSAEAPSSDLAGDVDVQVVTPRGESPTSNADVFTYVDAPPPPPPPQITGVSPSAGDDLGGDTVTIAGSGFTGATDVEFGGNAAASFDVKSDTRIDATTWSSYQPETVDVTVTGPGGTSPVTSADQFAFEDTPPTITSISPTSGSDLGGTPFTITGSHLGNGDNTSIEIGGQSVTDAVCAVTTCTGTTPPGADGPADVTAYNYNLSLSGSTTTPTLSGGFTYTKGPQPTIDTVTPDTGIVSGGTQVVITGNNLSTGEVQFGSTYADASCTDTVCVATAPPAPKAETVHISITTNAGTSTPSPTDEYGYVHLARPSVTAVTPNVGYLSGDTSVTVEGSNLTSGTVDFGGAQAYGECTATRCVVNAPSTSVTGPVHVTVTTPSGTSDTTSADEYTYVKAVVTAVSPSKGWTQGGTDVTISGSDLGGTPDDPATDVSISFGDSTTSGTCTGTSCTVVSPAVTNSTTAVDVRVTPPDGGPSEPTSSDMFTYSVRPAPTVTAVSPASGTDGGGTPIVVTGTALLGGSVYVGGTYAGNGCGMTSCSVATPHSFAGDTPVDVTVRTVAGESATSSADHFTYVAPAAPTVTGITPDHGTLLGGTDVEITGTDLTGAAISFGGTGATNVSCTPNSCTATTPAGANAGSVTVAVTTKGQTSGGGTATTSYAYEVPPIPVVTGVSPGYGPRSGGTPITVTGTDLLSGTVTVGGVAATSTSCTQTTCHAITPTGAIGPVDVTVTTAGGASTTGSADVFTYVPVNIAEHPIPAPGGGTVSGQNGGGGIVRGLGGDIWFTMPGPSLIGRISAADGTITSYATPTANASPTGIATGPDGRMWYAERNTDTLVAIDSGGTQTSYPVSGKAQDLRFLTAGPDGRVWFTFSASGSIGALDPSTKALSIYHLPDPGVFPYNIVPGPDGRLWFTEVYGSSIGAITADGTVTEYPLPNGDAEGWGLTVGTDNRLWFTETTGGDVGAITTSGRVQLYPVPGNLDDPQGILAGPDGRVWFTAPDIDQINALDPATGKVDQYAMPPGYQSGEAPRYLAMDASGALWGTENQGSHVLSADGVTSAVAPTVTGVAPNHGGAGTQVTVTGSNFTAGTTVSFGGASASAVTVEDPAHLVATAPSGSGVVDVTATTGNGASTPSTADEFSFGAPILPVPTVTGVSPDSGPVAGGTTVIVSGTDLAANATVDFGGVPATGVSCTTTQCTAVAPAGGAGPVDVTVATDGGTSAVADADRYVYLTPPPPRPTVTGVSPASGSGAGGDIVTVTGTDLTNATVAFGLVQARDATCSATSCTVTSPPNGAGPVDVRATTEGGTSARADADTFTYVATSKVPTTTTLTLGGTGVSGSPGSYTAPAGTSYVNLTAQISPTAVDGSVTLYDGSTVLVTEQVYSGFASTYESEPATGTHDFRAVFTPLDTDFYGSSEGTATLTVGSTSTPDPSVLTITAPSKVNYGSAMTATTTLDDASTGKAIAGASVSLFGRPSASASWTKVGSATTSSTGVASLRWRPKSNVQLQWRYAGGSAHAAATSATRSVSVAQVVKVSTTRTKVRHGRVFKVYGYTNPPGKGQHVTLQMKIGTRWRSLTSTVLKRQRLPNGATRVGYQFPRRISRVGSYRFRVVKAATASLAKGVSRTIRVRIV